MLDLMNAEWYKLRSTKAVWWTSALILIFGAGFGALSGFAIASVITGEDREAAMAAEATLSPTLGHNGFALFGFMVVMVQAVLIVTSEYGNGTMKTTFISTPSRWRVPVAKGVVYGLVTSVLSFVSLVLGTALCYLTMRSKLDNPALADRVGFSAEGVWGLIGRNTLAAVLAVFLCIGVGFLIRHTALGITLVLLWATVVEGLLVATIPKAREWLTPYMPFQNRGAAIAGTDLENAPWGATGSMVYFGAWAFAVFIIGIIVLERRDI